MCKYKLQEFFFEKIFWLSISKSQGNSLKKIVKKKRIKKKLGIYFLKRRGTEFERKTNNPRKMIDTWTFKILMKKKKIMNLPLLFIVT